MAKRKKKPVKLVTLDTETYNGLIGGLKRIAIYDGGRVQFGYKFSDIEPFLLSYKKEGFDVHVYIHNLEFDARKLPELFSEDRILWEKCFIINGKLTTIATKDYTVHDSFKLLPSSLKKLSKDFEVEHGKLDLWDAVQKHYPGQYKDVVDFLDRCDVDDPVYIEYLSYDVISLYEVLTVLIELTGLELHDFVGRISTSSLSRFLFKNGYKGEKFENPFTGKSDYEMLCSFRWDTKLEIEEFIRASYCGGRTEVFTPILDHPGFHYDVNSLYPAQFDSEYPIGKPQYYNDSKLARFYFERWRKDHSGLGFVSASVHIPKQNIPPLPCKMGKLVFPCGYVYGTWTFEELEYAMEECGVTVSEYYEVAFFERTYPVFKRFKDCFYQLKVKGSEEGNESLRTLAKLILNVMYGYTGMTRDKTQLRKYDSSQFGRYERIVYADAELGFMEVPADIKSEYIQVQVASYVTSRARLVLLKALREADKVGTVYYCDTDSIVTDHPLPPEMVHDSDLGKWKLESEPVKGLFLRPKVYAEAYASDKTTVKFKGVTKETQEQLTFDSYENLYRELLAMDKDFVIVEKNRLTMRSVMYMEKTGLDFSYYETRDKKMNLRTVEKRKINYAENVTEPYYFDSEEAFEAFDFKPPKADVQFSMTTKHGG